MKQRLSILTTLVSLSLLCSTSLIADESQLISMIQNLQGEMSQMRQMIDQQNRKIEQLEKHGPNVTSTSSSDETGTMSDPAFNERVNRALGGADKWLKDLTFKGDLRLRYEAFDNHSGSPLETDDRNRFRLRL